MSAYITRTEPTAGLHSHQFTLSCSPILLRSLLLLMCIASATLTAWLGDPTPSLLADAELARLLRGMAAIKAIIVLATIGVIFWRFGLSISKHTAATYMLSAGFMASASMLIWQLSFIPLAALMFHIGMFGVIFTAWRDTQVSFARL